MRSGCGAGVDISTFSSALWSLGPWNKCLGKWKALYSWVLASVKVVTSLFLTVSCLLTREKKICRVDGINLANVGKARTLSRHKNILLHCFKDITDLKELNNICCKIPVALSTLNHRDGHSKGGRLSIVAIFPSFKCPADLTRGKCGKPATVTLPSGTFVAWIQTSLYITEYKSCVLFKSIYLSIYLPACLTTCHFHPIRKNIES